VPTFFVSNVPEAAPVTVSPLITPANTMLTVAAVVPS
jgi:hypothetical protein